MLTAMVSTHLNMMIHLIPKHPNERHDKHGCPAIEGLPHRRSSGKLTLNAGSLICFVELAVSTAIMQLDVVLPQRIHVESDLLERARQQGDSCLKTFPANISSTPRLLRPTQHNYRPDVVCS